MNLGENINNAFEVVSETYESVYKLMAYCREQAIEKGEFELSSPKFLRWKSDNAIGGWLITSFILLFQHSKDKLLKNQWRQGPIYVMEINFVPSLYDEPMLNLAKFEYADLSTWGEYISPSDHWAFYEPLQNVDLVGANELAYSGDVVDETYSTRYWGLKRIVGIGVPLAEITRENAYEKIFGGFHSLIEK
jgi:hypothetical protein